MNSKKREFLSFDRSMLAQCLLLYIGICAGLWINKICLALVAGFTVLTAMFGKRDSVYHQLFFCLPFTMVYKLSPGTTSLFIYAMLAAGIFLIIRNFSFKKPQLFFIILFAVYICIGMGRRVTTVIKMIMALTLFLIFVKKTDSENFKNHIMSFSLGMLGSSFIGLLKGSWPRLDMYFSDMNPIYVDGERSFRFSGLYLDPNYYSISAIFAVTLCIMLFLYKKGNRVLLGTVIIALSIFGFISYSKMFLVSYLLMIVFFIMWALKSPKKIISVSVVASVGGWFLYKWMQSSSYLAVMLDRFSGEDVSTGRFGIWESYIGYIKSSPLTFLFGDGLGAPYYNSVGPHNTYIESVYFIGLLGSIIFLVALISIFRARRYVFKRSIINYALILIFLGMIATLGCLTVNDLMFYCMLLWISLNMSKERTVVNYD